MACSQRTKAAVPSWEPSVDTKKGSPREGVAGSPRACLQGYFSLRIVLGAK